MGKINKKWIERRRINNPSVQTIATLPIDALLKSINDTSGNARNLFVPFILLSVYILLTVGATNDEQLLRDSSIAVPFLSSINLPVSRFYQFVPWMFLIVHFDLLLLFKLMADKLHALNANLDKMIKQGKEEDAKEIRLQLSGMLFVHWLAGGKDDSFSHFITGLVVWSSLLVLPLLTLLALQIGFLPYHSGFTTFTHQLALGIDILSLIWFWPTFATRGAGQFIMWWLPYELITVLCYSLPDEFPKDLKKKLPRKIFEISLEWFFALSELCRRLPVIDKKPLVCQWRCRTISAVVLLTVGWFGAFVAVLPNKSQEQDFGLSNIIHRNLDLHEKLLVANDPSIEILAKLKEFNLTKEDYHDNLSKITGLDLQGRDLQFANFSKTKLWQADFRGANLQYSQLTEAQLTEAKFNKYTQLSGAVMDKANLQGSDLKETQLLGNSLKQANLQGSKLYKTNLTGANLSGTHWQEAHFDHTILNDTNLEEAEMPSADLHTCPLQGAVFKNAKLQGVNFYKVHLQVANMSGAHLQGAELKEAILEGANLGNAELQGSDLRDSQLFAADLSIANLKGANLGCADLRGAEFKNANLQGVNLFGSHLDSATFKEAHIEVSDLRSLDKHNKCVDMSSKALSDIDLKKKWQQNIKPKLNPDRAQFLEQTLIALIKAPTVPLEPVLIEDSLSDTSLLPIFLRKSEKDEPHYFEALSNLLGELACSSDSQVDQRYIASGIAKFRMLDYPRLSEKSEWEGYDTCEISNQVSVARRKLAKRLLQEDCTGIAGLDNNSRDKLLKLSEAVVPECDDRHKLLMSR